MSNPYNNEVIFNGQTLMSLKEDTVTPDKVLAGETFHDRSGAPQTGNLITHNVYDGLDSTSTSDALSANQGRVLNEKYDALNSNFANMFTRKYRTYSSITIPSSGYIKVDSYSEMDVNDSLYLISMNIRGWSGSVNGVTLTKSTSGTDFYLSGEANKTISSVTVEYVFSRY